MAFLVFLILLVFYSRKGMGGGDVKLLTVGYLWAGYTCMLPFSVLLLLFALIHAIVAKLGLVKTIGVDRRRIPFAPVVAAALIGTFMLGCLDQPPARYGPNKMLSMHFQDLQNGKRVSPPIRK